MSKKDDNTSGTMEFIIQCIGIPENGEFLCMGKAIDFLMIRHLIYALFYN